MTSVGVIAHSAKTLGGGLAELRKTLSTYGIDDPLWREVPKSRFIPKQVEKLLEDGVELLFVWGGDGTVQRVIDAAVGTSVTLAVLPAGTANLFATNLGIPKDVEEAVKVGLHGSRRQLDVGRINGEHFGVMAGTGLDALMIRDADAGLKDKVGRVAYVWTGAKNVQKTSVKMRDRGGREGVVQGEGELPADRQPRRCHRRYLGVLGRRARRRDPERRRRHGVRSMDWVRTLGRSAVGDVEGSPFVETTSGRSDRCPLGQGDPVRDRRRRPEEDQAVEVQGGSPPRSPSVSLRRRVDEHGQSCSGDVGSHGR